MKNPARVVQLAIEATESKVNLHAIDVSMFDWETTADKATHRSVAAVQIYKS